MQYLLRCSTIAICVLVALAHGTTSAARAEIGEQWAVVISVQQHDDHRWDLRFTGSDAGDTAEILIQRAGIPEDHLLLMTDQSADSLKPTLANLRREIPKLLSKAGPEDHVLVYFSGHGHPSNGKTYLIPRDFDVNSIEESALPAEEMRNFLTECRAATKFLILDCCHAGNSKSVEPSGLDAAAVAKAILPEPVTGCMVLASCRADEKSYEWAERRNGIFTYWLCRALEGGADGDGNGRVTADEVYKYTYERVSSTAAQVFGFQQNPAMYPLDSGFPVVLTLRPEPPETLCRRLAEHLDLEIRRRKLGKVGVLEFLQPMGRTEALAAANLPAYCAERVHVELKKLADDAYCVLSTDSLSKAAKGLQVEALGNPARMEPLRRDEGIDALITGVLRRRGTNMNVQCDLVSTEDGASLATPSGVLPLSEDLVGDCGGSFTTSGRPEGGPYNVEVVNHAQSDRDHPMLLRGEDAFPFQVEVWSVLAEDEKRITKNTPRKRKDFVVTSQRPTTADGKITRELLIAASENELFEIRIQNHYREKAAATVLVDGINILGQKRERLGKAWSWLLEPSDDPEQPCTHTFEGWYLPKGEVTASGDPSDFAMKRFRFVDVADSVAMRQNFGDSIGMITAAFYAERGRALGSGEGPEEARELKCENFNAGRLLGVINIRYVDERELDRLLEE